MRLDPNTIIIVHQYTNWGEGIVYMGNPEIGDKIKMISRVKTIIAITYFNCIVCDELDVKTFELNHDSEMKLYMQECITCEAYRFFKIRESK